MAVARLGARLRGCGVALRTTSFRRRAFVHSPLGVILRAVAQNGVRFDVACERDVAAVEGKSVGGAADAVGGLVFSLNGVAERDSAFRTRSLQSLGPDRQRYARRHPDGPVELDTPVDRDAVTVRSAASESVVTKRQSPRCAFPTCRLRAASTSK